MIRNAASGRAILPVVSLLIAYCLVGCVVQTEPGLHGTDGAPGPMGPKGDPGPAGTVDFSQVIVNGTTSQVASFNITGAAEIGQSLKVGGLDINGTYPFVRLSRNQLLVGTTSGADDSVNDWTLNAGCGATLKFLQTVKTNVQWADRSTEEKELLTAMGRSNTVYVYREFSIYRLLWNNGPCQWLMYQETPSLPAVTSAAFTKLEAGEVGEAWTTGIQGAWSLTGQHYSAEDSASGYIHPQPVAGSVAGSVLFAMPANVAGRVDLSVPQNWGWFPFVNPDPLLDSDCPDPDAPKNLGFCIWNEFGYTKTYQQAAQFCASRRARLCTRAEVSAAQAAGAQWCHIGWVADRSDNLMAYTSYPMQDSVPGCGGQNGVLEGTATMTTKWSANCCRP